MPLLGTIGAAASRGFGLFGAVAAAGDYLWNYVVALFNTTATNGAQNNTFLDSSTNNFTITRNGNTTQGSFSPYYPNGYWSNYFNGSSGYLQISDNTAFNFGTGDATVEFWFNSPGTSNNYPGIISSVDFNTAGSASIRFDNTGYKNKVFMYINGGGDPVIASTSIVSYNTWTHVAITRSGTSLKMYINGVLDTTVTISASLGWYLSYGGLRIGRGFDVDGASAYFPGYISNVRLVKGSVVYTSNFTPSTTPLTAISGTSLLTCQSSRFLDNSSNAFAITNNGSSSTQVFSPLGNPTLYSTGGVGGSGYFDGSGDYLSIADNAAFQMGSGAFTIECWFYGPSFASNQSLVAKWADGQPDSSAAWGLDLTSGVIRGILASGSTVTTWTGTAPPTNGWNHATFVRNSSNTVSLFLNGARVATASYSSTVNVGAYAVNVGSANGNNRVYTGYIADARVVKGTAVYDPTLTTYTVPTAPLTAITNTSLLCSFTNAGIYDAAAVNDAETVSSAQVSTTQAKFGTTSMSFNGSSSLSLPSSQLYIFGTGNFTIEAWIYFNSVANATFATTNVTSGFYWQYYNSALAFGRAGGGTDISKSWSPVANTWYHVATTRAGNTVTHFINGTPIGSGTFTDNISATTTLQIGTGGAGSFNGYIDELRITNGYARYWYPFTPPTLAFPTKWSPQVIPANDPLFPYVTMLLPGNGTNGAQNNTFLDSSTNAFTITRNGNTTQGTFTPYGSNWSIVTGSGNYLNTGSNAALGMGTGDFTVEAWIFATAAFSGYQGILADGFTTGSLFFGNTAGGFGLRAGSVGDILVTTAPSINQWVHVAVTRSGTTVRLFYNGVQQATTTNSTNFPTQSAYIGNDGGGSAFTGYISNLRLVKGTAVYTSAFTPSTTPLTAISGTSLLTCQSNRFIDNSSNAFAITVNGSPSVQRFSPFSPSAAYSTSVVGGSGYFDGTGDYLTLADNAAWSPAGNYTLECWYYPTAFVSQRSILGYGSTGSTVWVLQVTTGGAPYFLWYNSSVTGYSVTSSINIPLNTWNHIAVTFDGTNIKMYVNGATAGTTAYSGSTRSVASSGIGIGSWGLSTTDPTAQGYISDTRIVKGSVVYTAAFTPPTAPLTAITNTSLLCNYINGGIIDNAMMNDLETVGNAQISTTQSKFGGSSVYIPGGGANGYIPASPNLDMGTGDFTVECWVNSTSIAANYPSFIASVTGWSTGASGHRFNNTGAANKFTFHLNGAGDPFLTSTSTFSFGVWYHYALTRSGNTFRMFVNGNLEATGTSYSGTYNAALGGMRLGYSQWDGTNGYYNGYIDDLRITKGIARYVQNFTPPTQAFQTQ